MTDSAVTPLAGFPPEAFAWFAELEANNDRTWFKANRATFEHAVRDPLEELLELVAEQSGGQHKLFRQHRDVRFSADKSPYKTRTYGVVAERPDSFAPLYLELSASGLFAGTGYHQLAPDQLARFREAVADDDAGAELERAVAAAEAAGAEVFGELLKTAPRGYPRDHPRVRLLRHKLLVAGRRLAPGRRGIAGAAALEHAHATWAACAPLTAWLDERVGMPSA